MRKYVNVVFLVIICVFLLQIAASADSSSETVFDRKVHIEEGFVLDIPKVPSLCDEIKDLKKGYINIGDCKLYYEEEGKGIPIVLINGGAGCSHQYFHPYFSSIKNNARVIYYDQRGEGQSDRDETLTKYTIKQAVDDLDNLRKALKIDKWVVLGHSYGGFLAQCYALEYPQHVSGLILVAAMTGIPDVPELTLEKTRCLDYVSQQELNKFNAIINNDKLTSEQVSYNLQINGAWKAQFYYKPTKEESARFALYVWKHDPCLVSVIRDDSEKINLKGMFADFYIPTFIMESKNDLTWPDVKPQLFLANHPNAKMVVFEKSGHSPFMDEPENFMQELNGFMDYVKKHDNDAVAMPPKHIVWPAPPDPVSIKIKKILGEKTSDKTMATFEELKKSNLRDPDVWLLFGVKFFESGYYNESMQCWEAINALTEKDVSNIDRFGALVWQGQIYDVLGQRDKAIACYKQALKIDIGDKKWIGKIIIDKKYVEERLKKPFVLNK